MSTRIQQLSRVINARLSRRICWWVLMGIVTIEAIILIPSVYRRKQELLSQLPQMSSGKIAWIVETYPLQSSTDLLQQLANLNEMNPLVLGGTVYDRLTEKKLGTFGEVPQLTLAEAQQGQSLYLSTPAGERYDATCEVEQLKEDYIIVIRHNANAINQDIRQFIFRIAGLVLIISIFVTGGTMIILEKLLITPILNLRQDLIKAGNSISLNQSPPKFYSNSIQRSDELGDVITAFIQMFDQIYDAITERNKAESALRLEKEKSESLLLNILPKPIAEQLKQSPGCIADRFDQATILFADITDFTGLSSQLSPTELVKLLNEIFSTFDQLVDRYNLEKIKTIGDAYMIAGGIPKPRLDHATAIADIALEMQQTIHRFRRHDNQQINIRIGINTGPVVAGVIGLKKFTYDLWGDAVNIASRMESQGIGGEIQVSHSTYLLLKDQYSLEERGIIAIKGKGDMMTYWLRGKKLDNSNH
ncbi:MAG: adenylate/guanylate cyclase domain-containing protein [Microcoleaceae cyanobacterium]